MIDDSSNEIIHSTQLRALINLCIHPNYFVMFTISKIPKVIFHKFFPLLKHFLKLTMVMASFSTSNTDMKMISYLQNKGIIHSHSVIQGMSVVDHANYDGMVGLGNFAMPPDTYPYSDTPQYEIEYIGYHSTIAFRRMHGYTLENLESIIMVYIQFVYLLCIVVLYVTT